MRAAYCTRNRLISLSVLGRYYDPSTDQFLSIDPDLAETGQPYAFTGDDPLNATDPLGLRCKKGHSCPKSSSGEADAGKAASAVGAAVASGPYKPGSSGGPNAGKRATEAQRQAILKENDGNCVYCNDAADQVDHIFPRSKGGTNEPENLQPTCGWCNRSKSNRDAPNPKYPDTMNPAASDAIMNEEISSGAFTQIEQSGDEDLLPGPGEASELDVILDISAIVG